MLGKRRNVSLRPEAEEPVVAMQFQSKRPLVESSSQKLGGETFQQEVESTVPLDLQRAESSRQHVRALNTQFASWVQSQLENHPDELWEDGVQDYLSHASKILEKFSDVADWLKVNAAKSVDSPATGHQTVAENIASGNKINGALSEKPVFGGSIVPSSKASVVVSAPSFATPWSAGVSFSNQASVLATSPGFATSWSSGVSSPNHFSTVSTSPGFPLLWSSGVSSSSQASSQSVGATFGSPWSSSSFSNSQIPSPAATVNLAPPASTVSFVPSWSAGDFSTSQTSLKFGPQSSAPSNDGATDDTEGENEERPSSPSVKRTEEEGITVVHEVKCKLYVKSSDPADTDPWKDRGTGQLSIKCKEGTAKGTKDSKPVILVRNDVGKILLNASLYPGIKTNLLKRNALMAIFHSVGDSGEDDQVVARTFLIRTKNEEERNKLAEVIQEYALAT